jgi:hypothetical protein
MSEYLDYDEAVRANRARKKKAMAMKRKRQAQIRLIKRNLFAAILLLVISVVVTKSVKAKVIELLCKHFQESGLNINDYDITVGYCTNPEEAKEYRKEVEEAISTKLLESGIEFRTRIGVVTSCHTGPTALGVALMPKFDRFEA